MSTTAPTHPAGAAGDDDRSDHGPAATAGVSSPLTAADVAAWVSRFGADLFGRLDDLGALTARQCGAGVAPRRADLHLEAWCHRFLTEPGTPVAGAGAVFAPGVLADAPYWLEWWTAEQVSGGPVVTKLAAETDPRAVGFRDYTELPWYAKPLATGERHVTGPYVDYLCTDQYTLTFTQPLLLEGRFAGVVGADVLVAWFEEQLLDVLDDVEGTCLLVNAAGRVVTSSDAAWVTGDLVRNLPLEAWLDPEGADVAGPGGWTALRCPGLPFLVLSAD
ncbi:cache domain-containing protein [Intrasporangium flavum]|uniref:cache domain-containing protein n=1 Tax=Intrasporangium flavum TaxID=1428657 RepID=UPI0009FA7F04|nr:cache domain-containing protein [Intrasporangium flavum]